MRRIRKITWLFVVLATAVSTLLANMPFIVCACPTGQNKKTTASPDAQPVLCCCGSNCCSTPDQGSPCCNKKPADKPVSSDPKEHQVPLPEGPAIQPAPCQKCVLQPEHFLLSEREVTIAGEPFAPCANSLNCLQDFDPPIPAISLMDWEIQRLPPPTDLVIVLQHFVI